MKASRTVLADDTGGIALVIVLAFLALISVLTVSFFTSVQNDLFGAKTYASGVGVRHLADTATNIVMGQIVDATRSVQIPGKAPGSSNRALTWSSQPGLIHTHDDRGLPGRTYKLYSARNMVEAPNEGSPQNYSPAAHLSNEVPGIWPANPVLFTDLNAPVLVADPVGSIAVGERKFTANYPILDPGAAGLVDGFSIRSPPGYKAAPNGDPTVTTLSASANPAPMPVQWLYVLQNGNITAPDGSKDGLIAHWEKLGPDNPNKPSKDNPIVGRIAFWTDDETAKVNINTASEGVFWDRPWANTSNSASPFAERQLAQRIPARDEFQRFAGHPATTCLSPVLAKLVQGYDVPAGDFFASADYDKFRRYFALTPRVGENGTKAGTIENRAGDVANPAFQTIKLDQNRLYASVDELVFAAPQDDGPGRVGDRIPNEGLTRAALEKAKFFVTAYNRSPEVNLFGKPRITIWPIQARDPNAGKPNGTSGGASATCPEYPRNAKDNLIAFCATLANQPYYFQRYSIYLRDRVNNRGASGRPRGANGLPLPFVQVPPTYEPPSSQQPSLDWRVQRNRDLYRYLQDLTNQPIPGFGGNFNQKYSARSSGGASDRDQILTEMVDYLRSGANTYSTGIEPRYEYAPARDMPDATIGETQIVPLVPTAPTGGGTKGFGRFPTISEAALLFYRVNYTPRAAPPGASPQPQIRCLLIFEPVSPTCGPASWSPLVRYVVRGVQGIQINGAGGLFAANELRTLVTSRAGYDSGRNHSTAFNGLFAMFRRWDGTSRDANKHILNIDELISPNHDEEMTYSVVSRGVAIPPGQTTFQFNAANDIELEVHAGYAAAPGSATLVQRLSFRFPPGRWNVPADTGLTERTAGQPPNADVGINARLPNSGDSDPINRLVDTGADVLRSVELDPAGPSGGDIRLLAARLDVPSNFFSAYRGNPGPAYSDPAARMVHSLRLGNSARWSGTLHGELVAGTNITNPVAARGLRGAFMSPGVRGDWDNGNGGLEDGAYINKPDEGNMADDAGAYFSTGSFRTETGATFSPNRQLSSGVTFGSLPAEVFRGVPWRTLLFCANPVSGRTHPGFTSPRDHLLLDLFTMPIVEPYAISEPFSTAGKVNLNFQIAPFTYITRSTALRGVLKSTRVLAIPSYKTGGSAVLRRKINMDETLKAFEERFEKTSASAPYAGDAGPFRSASEICDMFLVPDGARLSEMMAGNASTWWWRNFLYTGDNAREIPYGHIYPRVTTKSNVFTVHVRVQTLQKVPSARATDWETWREGIDQVIGEYRGATVLERYIDLSDSNIPDFAKEPMATIDDFYKFRVVSTKRFAP